MVLPRTAVYTALALCLPLLISAACSSDLDCSLAGSCVAGACKCEAWAKGADCAALNLVPLQSAADLGPLVVPVANTTRWGSSPAFEGGVYHLFSAEMADTCSLGVWGFKSQVIHSVSTSATGPYVLRRLRCVGVWRAALRCVLR